MSEERANTHTAVGQAILALRRLNSALMISNRTVGARFHLKDTDLAVLDTLHQKGPQTPTELARCTQTHLATMTGILTRLERDGWIERRPNETDRRSISIHATGINRLTDTYAQANERLARLLESWTPDEVSMLTRFLSNASEVATAAAEEIGRDADWADLHRSSENAP
ncbi:MAG: MarR family transcriptional regulator [Propionibacterium sp.]|jgi:transcriptional regulator|nr:MarR family transcriptional regulator [Propionibacterium sp.]